MRPFMISFIILTLGITRCYLLPCNDGYLLVDTSNEKQYHKFTRELVKHNIKITDIKYVLLTHHHTDHTGFLQQLLDSSGATLIVHPKALEFIEKGTNNTQVSATTTLIKLLMTIKYSLSNAYIAPACKPVRTILISADNDTLLRKIGIAGTVVCVSGHTADGISIILDDGNVFAGDAAMNWKFIPGLGHWPLVSEDSSQVTKSWRKIIEKGGRIMHVAHGKAFSTEELINQ